MIISKEQMQNIVDEMKDTLQKDINIMDEAGCIIASTDSERIGMYHPGAQRIISQKLEELLICDDETIDGMREGINLPIVIEGEIVGVVGITGKAKDVTIFGKIIQRMAEIMIYDRYQRNNRQIEKQMRSNFVFNWLFDKRSDKEVEKELRLSGHLLNIDIDLPRVVSVLSVVDYGCESDEENRELRRHRLYNSIIQSIDGVIGKDKQQIVLEVGFKMVVFFHSDNSVRVMDELGPILHDIERRHKCEIYGGIGSVGKDRSGIKRSYREADIACSIAMKAKKARLSFYGDVDTEMLLQIISQEDRRAFLCRVFRNIPEEEWDSWMRMLRCLTENDGSISETASILFIHKNTLQYRLNKLKAITGYDPRNMKESVPLYLALVIYEMDMNNVTI